MLRCLTFALLVAAFTNVASAQNPFVSPSMMAQKYPVTVVRGYRSSPYFARYGYHTNGWQAYLNAHSQLVRAESNLVNAEARQINEVTRGITIQNNEAQLDLTENVREFHATIQDQKRAEYLAKLEARKAAYARLKAKKAAQTSDSRLAQN